MTKRILILSYGTRGDVQPLIALGLGLQQAGYEVVLGADVDFEPDVTALGLTYAPLRLNLRQFLNTEEGKTAVSDQKDPSADSFETMVWPMLDDCWTVAQQNVDLLIYDTMLTPAAHIAEKLGIPAMMTSVMPNMSPTTAFSLIGAPKIGWGGWGNKLSYQLYRLSWRQAWNDISRWSQATLGISPRKWHNYWLLNGRRIPILYSYSPSVLPRPADWPPETVATGYWFLPDAPYQPAPALIDFLGSGPPPIYVGFGSMVGQDAAALTELVITAVSQTKQRAVLATGWGGLQASTLPANIFTLADAPHEWLFPRMAAIIHHGGAGTTAAGLRYGKPGVLCPFVTDQFFWADIVHRHGWGPVPIPQKELTAVSLTQAIQTTLTDTAMHQRLQQIQGQLRAENGVETAVSHITHYLNSGKMFSL